jgi:dynein heavy chain
VADFVKDFHENAPFNAETSTDDAYKLINEWNSQLNEIEQEAKAITEGQELFEVAVNTWKELKTCRQELMWLKTVWDHVQLIQEIFASYRACLWCAYPNSNPGPGPGPNPNPNPNPSPKP